MALHRLRSPIKKYPDRSCEICSTELKLMTDRSAFEARHFSVLRLIRAALPHSHTPLSGSRKSRSVSFRLIFSTSLTRLPFQAFVIFRPVRKEFPKIDCLLRHGFKASLRQLNVFYFTLIFNTFARKFPTGFMHFF